MLNQEKRRAMTRFGLALKTLGRKLPRVDPEHNRDVLIEIVAELRQALDQLAAELGLPSTN